MLAGDNCYIRRDLSWLDFNGRVLEESICSENPLLERLFFLSVFTSNLDEFFMTRVGSWYNKLNRAGGNERAVASIAHVLQLVFAYSRPLISQKELFYERLREEMAAAGVYHLLPDKLMPEDETSLYDIYRREIAPLLSPQLIDGRHPWPRLKNKAIYLVAFLRGEKGNDLLAFVDGEAAGRLVFLPAGKGDIRFILTEDLLWHYAEEIFAPYTVLDKAFLRLTRNASLNLKIEDSKQYNISYLNYDDKKSDVQKDEDFASFFSHLLTRRDAMPVVRLELSSGLAQERQKIFLRHYNLSRQQLFDFSAPPDFSFVEQLKNEAMLARKDISEQRNIPLVYTSLKPCRSCLLKRGKSLIEQIEKRDVLLCAPFEDFSAVNELLEEAVCDGRVTSIKICLYRIGSSSRLMQQLCRAAEAGKEVVVMVEIKARFDEEQNIYWASRLKEAGARIIYGASGYKVHSKVMLITYRQEREVRYIAQIGTGNYNEQTIKTYTDFSLLTAHPGIVQDVARFFRGLALGVNYSDYQELWVSPLGFRKKIIAAIDEEISYAKKEGSGFIVMKMNSLTDREMIAKLIEASQAGVEVKLLVRGICCIKPMVAGFTDNLQVVSIVGRFLEHGRAFCFGKNERRHVYISSADLMTRNLSRRVEVACPIYDAGHAATIRKILDIEWRDGQKGRILGADSVYRFCQERPAALPDSQLYLFDLAKRGLLHSNSFFDACAGYPDNDNE